MRMDQYAKLIAAVLSNLVVLGGALGFTWASDISPETIQATATVLAVVVNAVMVWLVPNAITDKQRREVQDEPQVQAKDVQELADKAQDLADDAKKP